MPTWSNTDAHNSKPKFNYEREVSKDFVATTANTTSQGNTVITFTYFDGTASSNLSNVISIGDTVSTAGIGANGYPDFFASNVSVTAINGNNVVFSSGTYASVPAGTSVQFDKLISYSANKPYEKNYNADTVLLTASRLANAVFAGTSNSSSYNLNSGMSHQGLNKVTTFTGGRAGRVQTETLVILANPVTSNTLSGNTSNSLTYFAGL